jgi:hypothetical protein
MAKLKGCCKETIAHTGALLLIANLLKGISEEILGDLVPRLRID